MTFNEKCTQLLDNSIRIFLYGKQELQNDGLTKAFQCFELVCKSMCPARKRKDSISNIVIFLESKGIETLINNKIILGEARLARNDLTHGDCNINHISILTENMLRVITEILANELHVEISELIEPQLILELNNKLFKLNDKTVTAETNLKQHYFQTHDVLLDKNDSFENNFTREICPNCGYDFLYVEDQFIDTRSPFCFYCFKQIDAIECDNCCQYILKSTMKCPCGLE